MEPVKLPNKDNAYKDGALDSKYWFPVVGHLNLWHAAQFKFPSTAWGSAKLVLSDNGVIFDFTKLTVPSLGVTQRLQLIPASVSGIAKARVSLGKVAGRKADSSMVDPSDSPNFVVTFGSSGVKRVYCDVTVAYDSSTGEWASSACTISNGSSVPANTATHIYVEIGSVNVVVVSGGLAANVITPQPLSGDQWVARTGNASTYVDAHGLV